MFSIHEVIPIEPIIMKLLKGSFETMLDLFESAKKQLIISLPNLSDELAQALIAQKENRGLIPDIFIEFNENSYRAGFGDIEGIERLRKNGIIFRDKNGFNIYFIISDESGYFYFPKSRFYEKEGSAYDMFPMIKAQLKELKFMFNLLDDEDPDFENYIDNIGIDIIKEVSSGITLVEEKKSIILENEIKKDPPLKPIFSRKLEVYKAKFQFVELKFTGANLHVKKVHLPSKALPFKDLKLKRAIEANLRLFYDLPDKKFLQPFFDIKAKIDLVRTTFLFYLQKREKNLIVRTNKPNFESALNELIVKISGAKTDLINDLQNEIALSRNQIRSNLIDFLMANVPEEYDGLSDQEVLLEEITNDVNGIIKSIHFPKAKDLLEELKLEWRYYDITWEDLNDADVIIEMVNLGILDEAEKAYFDELAIGAKKDL